MKDPQTGQSLGNMENDCCEVVVNRVTPKVSYGQLENIKIKLDGVDPGVLQVRGKVAVKVADAVPQPPIVESPSKSTLNKVPDTSNSSTPEKPKEKDW